MSNRRLSWNTALRDLRDDRTRAVPGVISARSLIQGLAHVRRTRLVTAAGAFDRSAIMAAAVEAAKAHQERTGAAWAASMSYAHAWGPRCRRGEGAYGSARFNDAGTLVQWIGDALTAVESAVHKEARRRIPADCDDRETRLSMLAVTTIDNGDPDETEGFARELLAHAAAWREGR